MEHVFIRITHPDGKSLRAEAQFQEEDFDAFVKFLDFTFDNGCSVEAIEDEDIDDVFAISKIK